MSTMIRLQSNTIGHKPQAFGPWVHPAHRKLLEEVADAVMCQYDRVDYTVIEADPSIEDIVLSWATVAKFRGDDGLDKFVRGAYVTMFPFQK